jgi:ferredoxin
MSTVIYCFSGTGNSLAIARDIARNLEDTQVIPVNHHTLNTKQPEADRVGFVFPVYFWGLPRMMKDFIAIVNIAPGTYCFAVATNGGSDFISLHQIDSILAFRGLKMSYTTTLLMPGNYVLMYPVPSGQKQVELTTNAGKEAMQIAGAIGKGSLKPVPERSGVLKAIAGIVYRIGYLNKKTDHNFRATDACTKCGICAKVCPSGNITLPNGKPVWNGNCHQCLACLHWCPTAAIQYKKATLTRGRYHHPDIKVEDMFTGYRQ